MAKRRITACGQAFYWGGSYVGASLLARNPSAPMGIRFPALSLTTLASKLAPTGKTGSVVVIELQ